MRTRSSPRVASQYGSQSPMQSTANFMAPPGGSGSPHQRPYHQSHLPQAPSQLSQTAYSPQQLQQHQGAAGGIVYPTSPQNIQNQQMYANIPNHLQQQQHLAAAQHHPATRQHLQQHANAALVHQQHAPQNGQYPGQPMINGSAAAASNILAIPIMTPANNPAEFQSPFYQPPHPQASGATNAIEKRLVEQKSGGTTFGYGVIGAPLLPRILMSLKSGIQVEEQWALGSLVEISFTSPQLCSLKVNDVLTATLLKLLKERQKESSADSRQKEVIFSFDKSSLTKQALNEQQRNLETLLIIRNLAIEPENAQYLGSLDTLRKIVAYGLDMGNYGVNEEYLHYCLEILESTSFYISCNSDDDKLFSGLVSLVAASDDRSILVPALRSLSRLLIQDELNICSSISASFISQILRYLLTTDYELIAASLDFLYQYTAHPENISQLMSDATDTSAARRHLVRLLTFGMTSSSDSDEPEYPRLSKRIPDPIPEEPPQLRPHILEKLMAYTEPERAVMWMRSCYKPNPRSEVSQISLWKAYEAQFEAAARAGGTRLLPAVEFIRNVSAAFHNSQVIVYTLSNGTKKFVVKGIQPRPFDFDPDQAKSKEAGGVQDQPPVFGVTVALVLQNIGRSPEGKRLLKPVISDLIKASLVNPNVGPYIGDLLVILGEDGVDDEQK